VRGERGRRGIRLLDGQARRWGIVIRGHSLRGIGEDGNVVETVSASPRKSRPCT
jgi:hypothetical protein